MARKDYTRFVHEYVDDNGVTRYAVAAWDARHGCWFRPMTIAEQKASGNRGGTWIGSLSYLGGPTDRKVALRKARYIFAYMYDEALKPPVMDRE